MAAVKAMDRAKRIESLIFSVVMLMIWFLAA
jgi:hypothetical protein